MDNNELMHHGIPGMKWGVRRYQNKDGTLTAKGKARYEKEMAKLKEEERVLKNKQRTKAKIDKLEAKKQELADKKAELEGKKKPAQSSEAPKKTTAAKRSLSDMDDKELEAAVRRMNLEERYKQLNPPQVSAGKKFLDSVKNDVLAPALKSAGKKAMEKVLDAAFGKAAEPIINNIKGATKKTDKIVKEAADKEFKKQSQKGQEFKKQSQKGQEFKKQVKRSDDRTEWYDGVVTGKAGLVPVSAPYSRTDSRSGSNRDSVEYYDGIVRDATPALPSGTSYKKKKKK